MSLVEKGKEGKEKQTTVTGWVADKLKAQGKKGKEGGKAVPKIKPSKEHPTKSQATRAFLAGLFRSMKSQGKDVGAMDKGGAKKGKKESVRVSAATIAENMIARVMQGEDAFIVLSEMENGNGNGNGGEAKNGKNGNGKNGNGNGKKKKNGNGNGDDEEME